MKPGQYFDAETGTHYNYFRDYEAGTGRYVESDPIGLLGGVSTFSYALGNPLSHKDARGLIVVPMPLPIPVPPPVAPLRFDDGIPDDRPDDPSDRWICLSVCSFLRAGGNLSCWLLWQEGVYTQEQYLDCILSMTLWYEQCVRDCNESCG